MPQLEEQALYDQFKAGGGFEGQIIPDIAGRASIPLVGIASTKNGISCAALMATQLKVLQCPSDPTQNRISTTQSEWAKTPVAVTNYKGVLDDTFLGQPSAFSGTVGNDGTTVSQRGGIPNCPTGGPGYKETSPLAGPERLPQQPSLPRHFLSPIVPATGEDRLRHRWNQSSRS